MLRNGRMAQWFEVSFFRWRKLGCTFKSPRSYLYCFFFIVFLPFGLFRFILITDPF